MTMYPKQKMTDREKFVITGKVNKGTLMSKTLIETTQYDKDGNVIPYYDGAETWYAVQRYNCVGIPAGCKYFGGDLKKARKYFESNCW